MSHRAPLETGDAGLAGVDAAETEVVEAIAGIAPDAKRVFDEVLEVLLEDGDVEEAFPLSFLAESESLFDADFHVGGGFGSNVEGGEDVDAAHLGLDEFLGDAGEPEALADAGAEIARLPEAVVQTGSEDRLAEGHAVEDELLVSPAGRDVQPLVGLDLDLQVAGHVGRVVDGVAGAGRIELGHAARPLGVDAAGGGPQFSAVLGARFTLPGARGVALVVVVVVDEAEEAALDAVVPGPD